MKPLDWRAGVTATRAKLRKEAKRFGEEAKEPGFLSSQSPQRLLKNTQTFGVQLQPMMPSRQAGKRLLKLSQLRLCLR